MAKKGNFSNFQETEEKEQPKSTSGHGNCHIYNCPMPGHIYTGSWNCRYHYGKNEKVISRITHLIAENKYLFLWHCKLLGYTVVDWDVGAVQEKTPNGLQALPKETWFEYKKRIEGKISDLLNGAKTYEKIEYKNIYKD